MKKIFLFFLVFMSFTASGFACNYTVSELQATGETTLNLNIRNAPCTSGTTIFGKTKVGENYNLIGEALDYYQIEYQGKIAFIWKEGVHISNTFTLSDADTQLISLFVKKIQTFSSKEQNIYKNKLQKVQENFSDNTRIQTIISTVLQQLETQEKRKIDEKIKTPRITSKDSDEATVIAEYWLSLYNNYRKKIGISPYIYDKRLQQSAEAWSKLAATRGYMNHKRNPEDSYYDFWKIQDWFKRNGVHCRIENRSAAVENIGWGVMYCNKDNCTEELKKTVKKTFDFYMSEKGKASQPHYKSIVAPYLGYIGFGIYKQDLGNGRYKVYNTTHFCTEFVD